MLLPLRTPAPPRPCFSAQPSPLLLRLLPSASCLLWLCRSDLASDLCQVWPDPPPEPLEPVPGDPGQVRKVRGVPSDVKNPG